MSTLTVSGLAKSYGPTFTFGDRTFRVARGETIGLAGINGADTSTRLRTSLALRCQPTLASTVLRQGV